MSQLAKIQELFQNKDNKLYQDQWFSIYSHGLPWMMRVKLAGFIESQVWHGCCEEDAKRLWEQLIHGLLTEIDDEEPIMQFARKQEVDKLKEQYQDNPLGFATDLHACLEEERSLIETIQNVSGENSCEPSSMETEQTQNQLIVTALKQLGPKLQTLKGNLEILKTKDQEYIAKKDACNKQKKELEEEEQLFQDLQRRGRQNGVTQESLKQKRNCFEILKEGKKASWKQVEEQQEQTKLAFESLMDMLKHAVELVLEEVRKWKEEEKLIYVFCLKQHTVSIKHLADWCGRLGEVLDKTWLEIIDRKDVLTVDAIQEVFINLLQQTFVVSQQPCNVWKIEAKRFKCSKTKAEVRILALEKLEHPVLVSKVTSIFLHERVINECHKNKSGLEERSIPLEDKKEIHFRKTKAKGICAQFENLKLASYSRPGSGRVVCEEKYRLIFQTQISAYQFCPMLQTISLPIIVTTASNQWCGAQGSLLWQCFSTDPYVVPIADCPDSLPWPKVAHMLDSKLKLFSDRDLTPEQLNHLASKLTGKTCSDFSDYEIQFTKFCLDKMESKSKKNVEFWKWFLSVVNLMEKYLSSYWNDGLIEGFISKETAREKLKDQNVLPGTILLRFSDQCLTRDQGEDLCGAISVVEKVTKEKVQFPEPLGDDRLKLNTLANWLLSWINEQTRLCQFSRIYTSENCVELKYLMKYTSEESLLSMSMTPEGYLKNNICLVTTGMSHLSTRDDESEVFGSTVDANRDSKQNLAFSSSQPQEQKYNTNVSQKRNAAGLMPGSPSVKTARVETPMSPVTMSTLPSLSGSFTEPSASFPCITNILQGIPKPAIFTTISQQSITQNSMLTQNSTVHTHPHVTGVSQPILFPSIPQLTPPQSNTYSEPQSVQSPQTSSNPTFIKQLPLRQPQSPETYSNLSLVNLSGYPASQMVLVPQPNPNQSLQQSTSFSPAPVSTAVTSMGTNPQILSPSCLQSSPPINTSNVLLDKHTPSLQINSNPASPQDASLYSPPFSTPESPLVSQPQAAEPFPTSLNQAFSPIITLKFPPINVPFTAFINTQEGTVSFSPEQSAGSQQYSPQIFPEPPLLQNVENNSDSIQNSPYSFSDETPEQRYSLAQEEDSSTIREPPSPFIDPDTMEYLDKQTSEDTACMLISKDDDPLWSDTSPAHRIMSPELEVIDFSTISC